MKHRLCLFGLVHTDPSSSKEEPFSPELRVYNTLVTPVRKVDIDSTAQQVVSSADENQPPPALVWEPRDPPLQYSGVLHYDNPQPKTERPHRRVEARRSASLSQADNVFYDGKMLPRLQSQSPVRSSKMQPMGSASDNDNYNAAARYEEYYETKYEKPMRRDYHPPSQTLITADESKFIQPPKFDGYRGEKTAWRSQSDDRLRMSSRGQTSHIKVPVSADVEASAVLKSRWRSASPPPLTDDWVPIKPPHLAWAKAIPVETVERSDERRRGNRSRDDSAVATNNGSSSSSSSRRSKIPVMQPAIPRSVSGDMIYLERDSSDVLRERTLSIDRGINSSAGKTQPSDRILYKTYEEELRDYQGRTGSVDRMANRGRPRTIRMGTLSHAGKSVPTSLERRHSEVGSRERRRDAAHDDSALTVTRVHRRGSGHEISYSSSSGDLSRHLATAGYTEASVAASLAEYSRERDRERPRYRPDNYQQQEPAPVSTKSATRNINRVYIDGNNHEAPIVPIRTVHAASNQPASQIRVTMTDTRSLKRPPKGPAPNPNHMPMDVAKFRPAEVSQPTTLPRMNKRSSVNPGSTTVYLTSTTPEESSECSRHESLATHHQSTSTVSDATYYTKAAPKRIKTDAPNPPTSSFDSGRLLLRIHSSFLVSPIGYRV